MTSLYLKHLILRTPLEPLAKLLKHAHAVYDRRHYPALKELTMEPDRIEEVLRHLLQPDSNCIDIGCHIGSFTTTYLRFAPKGRHLAFEPIPEKVKWLRLKFPEVDVREMALGATSEKRRFFQDLSQPGLSGFASDTVDKQDIVELMVDCERLDNVVPRDRRFSFIKIDAEGAEVLVLDGARRTIARDRPFFLFESCRDGSEALDRKRDQLFSFVRDDLGYRVFKVKDFLERGNELDIGGFQAAMKFPFQALNFLAVPPNYAL